MATRVILPGTAPRDPTPYAGCLCPFCTAQLAAADVPLPICWSCGALLAVVGGVVSIVTGGLGGVPGGLTP